MKLNQSIALTLLLCGLSCPSYALTLGIPKLSSFVGEPLLMEISIQNLQIDGYSTIKGKIMSPNAIIDNMNLIIEARGKDIFVLLTTSIPVMEPFQLLMIFSYQDKSVQNELLIAPPVRPWSAKTPPRPKLI